MATHFRLRDVRVVYGADVALSVDDLSIARGESVAIVGPSGAGKTTLLRVLGAAIRPSGGCASVAGRPLDEMAGSELRSTRTQIGFIHQDLGLVPNLRVLHNVMCGRLGHLGLAGSLRRMLLPPQREVAAVHAVLERVGIGEKLYQRTDKLSGGQRQRVAIARALFQEPGALLADEPVSSVDPARARDTVALLTEISRERGLTLCASLHNLQLAREMFPRLIGMRHGRIAFDRPSAEVNGADLSELYRLSARDMLDDA